MNCVCEKAYVGVCSGICMSPAVGEKLAAFVCDVFGIGARGRLLVECAKPVYDIIRDIVCERDVCGYG